MATEYRLSYTASDIDSKLGKIDSLAGKDEIPTKMSDLTDDKGYLTAIPSEYVTETELTAKGYLTEHQSLADYAKTADLGDLATKDTVSKTDLATDVQTSLGKADTALQSYTETDPTVPSWAKAATKPTYTASEVGALPDTTEIPTVPTNVSAFTNDAGYLTEHQSLADYAKTTDLGDLATKDSLSATEVGADASGTASSAVSAHNTSTTAHNDIRNEISQISSDIVDLKAEMSQLTPEFADSIEECTDTSKMYVLPDGYIYAYQSKTQEIFTDVLQDVGYNEGYRVNSSGGIVAWYKPEDNTNYADTTNHIPCKSGDIIRVKNMPIPAVYTSGYYWNKIAAYDADKAYIDQTFLSTDNAGTMGNWLDAVTEGDYVVQFTVAASKFGDNVAYIVIGAQDITAESEVYVNSTFETVNAWTNTGLSFVSSDYSTEIADHEARLKLLEANEDGSGIPDYWLSELETKSDAIRTAMVEAGRNKSAFLWYTDAHWQMNSKMSPVLLEYLWKNTPMNKINFGGDIVCDPSPYNHDNVKYVYDWRKRIKGLPNHHSVYGNHDLNHWTTDVHKIAYSLLIAPEESAEMVVGGDSYYYIDNPSEKTRYLYLSYLTSSQTEMLAQGQFIVDALKSVPENWHIVAIAHRWWQYSSSSTPTVGSVPAFESDILSVFDAYNARTTRSGSNYFYAQDFTTGCSGKVEFCVGGHIHIDHDFRTDGGIPVIITASDTNQERASEETEDSGVVGTTTESAVFGIIADYNDADNTKITVVGIGRGTSRVINTNETIVQYSVTNNLTNCTNSNTATTVEDGTSYSATITSNNGYVLDSVSVTMGGSAVSVTDGVISIASVTGDIVITATATASTTIEHTNYILSSIESDGTPYNDGVGYKEGYRLNSSGAEAALAGCVVSGFIPYNGEDIEVRIPNTSTTGGNNYLHLYNNNFVKISKTADGTVIDGSYHQLGYWVATYGAIRTIDEATVTQKITIPKELIHSDTAYIRVSATVSTTLNSSTFDVALDESIDQ